MPSARRTSLVSRPTDLLIVLGSDGCFKRLNPGFSEAFGYTPVDMLDKPFLMFIHPDDRPVTTDILHKLLQGEPTLGFENRFHCKDQSYRRLVWTAMPTPDGLLYAVASDITEHSRTEEQERPPSPEAGRAAAVAHKERVLAAVCHDLQQPLTVVLAQTQLLERQFARGDSLVREGVAARLTYIFTAATRMRTMCQDLLDASLQQSGQPPLVPLAPTDLVALARHAIAEQELLSDLHRFVFEPEVPALEAAVDDVRVHRVLANLLTNAVKYSPGGGEVRVTVRLLDGPGDPSALLVVRDQGLGIPPDDLPYIFDPFHRGANVVGRFSGTGLGLASARELVEVHGGTISVESEDGKGSAFAVRLPINPPATRSATQRL